jgi:hypothetical protein
MRVRVFYLREVHKFFDADAATGIDKCESEFHLSQKVSAATALIDSSINRRSD